MRFKMGHIALGMMVLLLAGLMSGCITTERKVVSAQDLNELPVPNSINFGNPDKDKLERAVNRYKEASASLDYSQMFFAQQTLREILETNSNNKLGEKASFYIGKIYFEVNDYYNAQVTFNQHMVKFPESSFEPEIEQMLTYIDDEIARYNEWLENLDRGQATY